MRQTSKPSARRPGALSGTPSRGEDLPEAPKSDIYAEVTERRQTTFVVFENYTHGFSCQSC
jgi:hypothetical protein